MNADEPRTLASIRREWDPPLSKRVGGPRMLAGLDVYFDFTWQSVIKHPRTTFPNGKDLAEEVREACPDGKTPCLLLTMREDVDEGQLHTDDAHYVFVIHIRKYLEKAAAGPAMAYIANELGLGGAAAMRRRYRKAIPDAQTLDDILDLDVDKAALIRWVGRNSDRIIMLREIVGSNELRARTTQDDLARSIAAVDDATPDLRNAMVMDLWAAGPDAVNQMASELASRPDGRRAASIALADHFAGRIEDMRSISTRYRQLLSDPATKETDLQDFIEEHPLLLGFEYVDVQAKQDIPRGQVDFMVQRHDGYHDLLELKGPNDPIIQCNARGKRPHAPSAYSIGRSLAQALAQVHIYRERLTSQASAMEELYEISHTKDPRVTIVIGRASDLPDKTAKRILRQLNLTLHRMEVMPYDVLADRADAQLKSIGAAPLLRTVDFWG